MGRSFYYGNDAQLYTGSAAFATKISATPLAFGLTAPAAAAYQTLNNNYAAAYLAALDPVTRTKPKVQAKRDARNALVLKAAELAKIVEATPTVTNEQKLDLGLSVRGTPQPVNTLGTPSDFTVSLGADGSPTIKWKCASPRATGVVYQVWRSLDGGTDFIYVGGTGQKEFTDTTIPAGTSPVVYKIQAARSTAAGPWAIFNLFFGTSSSGAMTATVQAAAAKVAA